MIIEAIAPSTNQQQQTAIAPNLNQTAIASNIPTSTRQAIAPQQTNNVKIAISINCDVKISHHYSLVIVLDDLKTLSIP